MPWLTISDILHKSFCFSLHFLCDLVMLNLYVFFVHVYTAIDMFEGGGFSGEQWWLRQLKLWVADRRVGCSSPIIATLPLLALWARHLTHAHINQMKGIISASPSQKKWVGFVRKGSCPKNCANNWMWMCYIFTKHHKIYISK